MPASKHARSSFHSDVPAYLFVIAESDLHPGRRGGAKCKMGRFIKGEIRPETEICPT